MGLIALGATAIIVSGGTAIPGVAAAAAGGSTGATAAAATGGAVAATASATATAEAITVTASVAASGPIGWLVVGADVNSTGTAADAAVVVTLDCWKDVVHDKSTEPSRGKKLIELMEDCRIKRVSIKDDDAFPEVMIENIWGEHFRLDYLVMPTTKQVFGHAVRTA